MTYDLFLYGLYGSFIGMAYFIAIALASTVPFVKKPFHKSLELLIPVYLVGFVMNIINMPPILTGLIVIGAYLISMKSTMDLSAKIWIPIVFSFAGILVIFSFVPLSLRNYMFIFLVLYIFVKGKMTVQSVNKLGVTNVSTV